MSAEYTPAKKYTPANTPAELARLIRHGGDMSVPLASLDEVYGFLRSRYLHSRFGGSSHAKDHPSYAVDVAKSARADLERHGLSCIDPFSSNTGRIVWFDRALRVLNPDEPPAQIQAQPGHLLSRVTGGSFS